MDPCRPPALLWWWSWRGEVEVGDLHREVSCTALHCTALHWSLRQISSRTKVYLVEKCPVHEREEKCIQYKCRCKNELILL